MRVFAVAGILYCHSCERYPGYCNKLSQQPFILERYVNTERHIDAGDNTRRSDRENGPQA